MITSNLWLRRIRNLAGFLGMILPWLSLIGAFIVAKSIGVPKNFWSGLSISETYYVTPALTGVLTTASIVLMCYDGYDWRDNVITTISGFFGLCIVLFPVRCAAAPELVGFFQLPVDVSNVIHCASSIIFFTLLSINCLFLFTLGESNTKQKKFRNAVYRFCGIGMLVDLALMLIPVKFFAKTFIIEAVALTFFGVSWLVKGQVFGLFSDKE